MLRSRPCLAEPPAQSPSTRNSSHLAGSRSWQSASLPGRRGDVHRALAPGQLARLLGGFARGGGVDDLADHRAGMGRVFLQPFAHLVGHQAFERLAHFGGDQLVLGLRRELGIGQLDRDNRGQPFAHVVAGQGDLFLLQDARFLGIIVDRPGQRRAEGGQMRAAVALGDVVGEAQDVFVIAVVPFQRDIDADAVALGGNGDGIGQQRRSCCDRDRRRMRRCRLHRTGHARQCRHGACRAA